MRDLIRTAIVRLTAVFRGRRLDRELNDEVQSHLDLLEHEFTRQGMTPAAARAAARRAFGGVDQIKEQYRDRRSLPLLDTTASDLRYALRMLRNTPAFTVVIVASLALGIGANMAVFTVIDAIILRALPVWHPGELVVVGAHSSDDFAILSYPMYRDLRAQQQVFTDMFASAGETPVRLTIPTGASVDNVRASFVNASYFPVLGLQPAIGRFFTEEEDRLPNSAETQGTVAVLSDGFWTRQFGRDPTILDRTILVNRSPCRVIGVAPRGFTGEAVGGAPDIWIPLVSYSSTSNLENRRGQFTAYMARLKPNVSHDHAQAQLTVLFQQLLRAERPTLTPLPGERPPKPVEDYTIQVQPGATGIDLFLRRTFSLPLWIMFAVVALVLVIACANVANLLLARAAWRQRELMVRLALGCARGRLVRQLLTESLLLSLLGGAGGIAIAYWGSHALLQVLDIAPIAMPIDLSPDARLLAFMLGLVLVTGVGFGLLPALRASGLDLASALKDQSRGGTSRRLKQRLSGTLVVAQVALSLLLLIGAGLLLRSLRNLQAVDLGFQPEHVLMFDLAQTPPTTNRDTALADIARQTYDRVNNIPGVQSASLSSLQLFGGSDIQIPITIASDPTARDAAVAVRYNTVSPGYFRTVGMTLIAGRDITTGDTMNTPLVAVINEAMAHQYFHADTTGAWPIGRTIAMQLGSRSGQPIAIVGIIRDTKFNNVRYEAHPMFYVSLLQFPRTLRSLEVQTLTAGATMVPALRQALLDVSKDIMIRRVIPLSTQVDRRLTPERMIAGLCTCFGLLALLLASIGLYGVMAYGVAQRTNEIGIRIALGAQRGNVLAMVLCQSLVVVVIGILIGLPLAWLATGVLAGFLFGLTPTDPLTIAGALLLLLAVAGIAAYLPARRATQVDPLTALRYE